MLLNLKSCQRCSQRFECKIYNELYELREKHRRNIKKRFEIVLNDLDSTFDIESIENSFKKSVIIFSQLKNFLTKILE